MGRLYLNGDAAALAEPSSEDGHNTVTQNGIRYDVVTIASGEGRTYALVATLDAACGTDDILSACR